MTVEGAFPRTLPDGLVLRRVETDIDAEKVVAANAEMHGPDVGRVLRHWLFNGHPSISRADWLFIEEPGKDEAAATLALVPVTWRYGAKALPVAEMGFVATRPDYRRRGLQRALASAFDRLAREQGYNLAAVEGIPGFYGQFGYEYAVPLIGGFDLDYDQFPNKGEPGRYIIRRATLGDAPALQRLYDTSIEELDIAAERRIELWEHQLSVPQEIEFYGHLEVLEASGRIVGYLRWSGDDWMPRLRILELAVERGPGTRERILALLDFASDQGRAFNKEAVRLQLPENHPAVSVARYLGALHRGYYGWQMKVLDPVGFLWAIKPVLERRISGSLLSGHNGLIVFDLYRERLALTFKDGGLTTVAPPAENDSTDVRLSEKQAAQLWLGWRGREAMEEWYPDFWCREPARHLVDVLFPRANAYIYFAY